jgi:hypothetical protein
MQTAPSVWTAADAKELLTSCEFVSYDMIKPMHQEWFWKGILPRRYTTILAGGPGIWKGFTAADFMARMTQGWPLPDGSYPEPLMGAKCVGSLTWEDDPNRAMVWRYAAAGTELSRVFNLTTRPDNGKRNVLDEVGIAWLYKLAENKTVQDRGGLGALYIDPLMCFAPCGLGDNKQVREQIIDPLDDFAAKYDLLVYVNHHMIKDGKKVAGSQGLIDACRNPLTIMPLEGQLAHIREIKQIKSNIAAVSDTGPRYTVTGQWPDMTVQWFGPGAFLAHQPELIVLPGGKQQPAAQSSPFAFNPGRIAS